MRRIVSLWLFSVAFLVFCMIILGGYTRLSNAGLSIVEWKPVTGILPPLTAHDWASEFAKYKNSPEFKDINYDFDLTRFKSIYWIEYCHRLLGRIIGLVFIVPFIYFMFCTKALSKKNIAYLVVVLVFGAFQGFIGWYMVKSGLVSVPHVSHYRLAVHLLLALGLYGMLIWMALGERPHKKYAYAMHYKALLVLVVLQIFYGALVAGLNAGLVYNTFPLMGQTFVPHEWLATKPIIKNFFENPVTVQFIHRMLAYVICVYSMMIYIVRKKTSLSTAMIVLIIVQVMLGIATLLKFTPLSLALLHQGLAVLVFTTLLFIVHRLGSGDPRKASISC